MNSTPEQLRFASIPAHTVRADFAGGGLSSDLGQMLLRGVDLQIGLTARITAVLPDRRHASDISHSYHDLLTQRIYQIGSGYEDATTRTACAYILHQQLRTQALQHTALSQAQPSTVIAKLFKIAVQIRQCKNKIVLHLPSACPVKHLLHTLTERLYLPARPKILNSS